MFRVLPAVAGLFHLWVLLQLAGCGSLMQLAYNNADFVVRMSVDDYLAPDEAQAPLAREAVAQFHLWHRKNELPRYAELLDELGTRVRAGLQEADVRWALANVSARYYEATGQAVRSGNRLIESLHDGNLVAIERKFTDDNAKFTRENLDRDEAKRHAARVRGFEKRFEEWLGDLTDAQRERIAAFVRATPRANDSWFAERVARQRRFIAMLRDHMRSPELTERIVRFLGPAERFQSPGRAEMTRDWEGNLARLLVDIDRLASPAQRAHVLARFAHYAAEFRALARRGS